jgi:hypothetical protein
MKKQLVLALALLLTTSLAYARGGGHGPGGPGGDAGGPGGGNAIVADNGTIIVTRVVTDSATDTRTTQLVAITAAGAQAWTATLTDRGHLVLSGSNLLSVSEDDDAGTTTITARSIATGAVAWTKTLTGRVTDLEPFSGGTYAIVVVPAATEGGTATRSVVGISSTGATLFTVNL